MPRGRLLTADDRTAIKTAIAAGRSAEQIAEQLGRSKQTICNEAVKMRLRFARTPKPPKSATPNVGRPTSQPAAPPASPLQERVDRVLAQKREQILDRAERIEDPVAAYAALSALRDNASDTAAWARAASLLPSEDSADLAEQISEFGEAAVTYMRERREAFTQAGVRR